MKYYGIVDQEGYLLRFKKHRAGVKLKMNELCTEFITKGLIQDMGEYIIHCDNYYGSIPLGEEIQNLGYKFVFTVRKNRPTHLWDHLHSLMESMEDGKTTT